MSRAMDFPVFLMMYDLTLIHNYASIQKRSRSYQHLINIKPTLSPCTEFVNFTVIERIRRTKLEFLLNRNNMNM